MSDRVRQPGARSPLSNWVPLDAGAPFACPYIHGRTARFELGATLPSRSEFDSLMALGYRRSGRIFYVPGCPSGCIDCTPIRVPVSGFAPSKSQRRVWRRHRERFDVTMTAPRFDAETYELYRRHHARVAPDEPAAEADGYRWSFIDTCVDTRFVGYRVSGRLVAMSVLDVGFATASSVYCAWDPEFASFGPGVLSALWELDWCRREGIRYYHLGYWIADNPRLDYKARFGPAEVFDWNAGSWHPLDPPRRASG